MLGALVALIIIVGAAFSFALSTGWIGISVTVVIAVAAALAVRAASQPIALSLLGAQPADEVDNARLYNLVEGLCIASGLSMPAVYTVDDPAMNALALGSDTRRASIVVTTGLLDGLERIELEGVLARELSLVRNGDIGASTLAVGLLGPFVAAADAGARRSIPGLGNKGALGGVGVVLAPLASPLAIALRFAVGTRHDTPADIAAVEMTRYPPGLIAAMEKLSANGTTLAHQSRATAHLWLAEPMARYEGDDERLAERSRIFDTHPPIEHRIEALREL